MERQLLARTNRTNHQRKTPPAVKSMSSTGAASCSFLCFQQTLGNRAVNHFIQTRCNITQPNDKFNPETERKTEQLARMSSLGGGESAAAANFVMRQGGETCTPAAGIPNSNCTAYLRNAWWLPATYVNNATCACLTTPNSPTANCVRNFLQDRLAVTPQWLKTLAAAQKTIEIINPAQYQAFVQAVLTPRIYRDHVDAYRSCCCPSGPAPYPSWIGVTTVPIQPCELVGLTIRYFGSCHGTPGSW
jgi:hypothetical protein